MNYRPSPNFVAALIGLLLLAIVMLGTAKFVGVVQGMALDMAAKNALAPSPRQDHRPDIRHCHAPDVDLWNCIINKE